MRRTLLVSPSKRPHFAPEAAGPPSRPVASPTGITRPEMPALRAPLVSWAGDDSPAWDEDTDVTRLSDLGKAPKAPLHRDRGLLLRADGVRAGEVATLGEAVILGRHTSADVVLDDAGVSRQHVRIERIGEEYFVIDLNSRNGTFLRGKSVVREMIHDGDILQLGPRVSFRFVLVDEDAEMLFQQLYRSSVRDALTGAYNRRHFDERLVAEITYAKRHDVELSLILLDIDHFKAVNDEHGHLCGDAVIKHVVKLTQTQIRTEDVFARFGGEEFAVLLRGIAAASAVRAAERIRATIEVLPASHEGRVIPVTVSGGVSCLAESTSSLPDTLIALADRRLYQAKHLGRNRVVWRV